MKILILFFLTFFLLMSPNFSASSADQNSGLKIPRFVSTKSDKSNLRKGANTDYPIQLTYTVENFPLEIIAEYEIWRKVVDVDGNQGWMHKSLLHGNRYGIIKTSHDQPAQIYNKPEGIIIGIIGNRNIVKINKCFSLWCKISFTKYKGWVNKQNVWGVYTNEEFNMPFYQFLINFYWRIILVISDFTQDD